METEEITQSDEKQKQDLVAECLAIMEKWNISIEELETEESIIQ